MLNTIYSTPCTICSKPNYDPCSITQSSGDTTIEAMIMTIMLIKTTTVSMTIMITTATTTMTQQTTRVMMILIILFRWPVGPLSVVHFGSPQFRSTSTALPARRRRPDTTIVRAPSALGHLLSGGIGMDECIHLRMCVHIHIYTYTPFYQLFLDIHVHIHICIYIYMYVYAYIHIYMYICVCMYVYIYIYANTPPQRSTKLALGVPIRQPCREINEH